MKVLHTLQLMPTQAQSHQCKTKKTLNLLNPHWFQDLNLFHQSKMAVKKRTDLCPPPLVNDATPSHPLHTAIMTGAGVDLPTHAIPVPNQSSAQSN